MRIGVPKEIKPQENRIGLTPDSVKTLVSEGHEVLVENNGGFEAGFENDQYKKVGAKIVNKASDIFNDAEIIVKVKEPQKVEVDMIRENQIVYTYLHLAAAKELTEGLIKSKSINNLIFSYHINLNFLRLFNFNNYLSIIKNVSSFFYNFCTSIFVLIVVKTSFKTSIIFD